MIETPDGAGGKEAADALSIMEDRAKAAPNINAMIV
jgi:hypothetical protein